MRSLPRDWPRAFAHVDADCFYVSCELIRRPELRGRPVAVMSSQDACVVAKSYDAKARGIATGMPVWEAEKRLPGLVLLPADFRFYGLMSARMFAVLARFSPEIERYSIDEGFLDMEGLRGLFRCDYRTLADRMRRAVREELGITVSIGISVNKLLAKMASEANKPDGSTVVPGRRVAEFLAGRSCGDIPGIGARRAALLRKFGVHTARQLADVGFAQVRRLLGKFGVDIWRELNGEQVFALDMGEALPKSMARTASLGCRTRARRLVEGHLSYHVFRLAMDMTSRGLRARRLRVMLRLGNFERVYADVPLPRASSSYPQLSRAAIRGLDELWPPEREVGACGVIAMSLARANQAQGTLFADDGEETRMLPLWESIARINRKYGRRTVQPAASAVVPERTGRQPRFRYPVIEGRAGYASETYSTSKQVLMAACSIVFRS
ncbi:MAG: DNA polymerase IV [Zetaproteobacteria bacterium]|nr:MAG: DNA polymerase IV [Zetaproteobacteria bacterium]